MAKEHSIETATALLFAMINGFIGVSLGALARFKKEIGVRRDAVVPLTLLALISGFP